MRFLCLSSLLLSANLVSGGAPNLTEKTSLQILPMASVDKVLEVPIEEWIARTYHPEIQVKHLKTEKSFAGCSIESYRLTGADPITRLLAGI